MGDSVISEAQIAYIKSVVDLKQAQYKLNEAVTNNIDCLSTYNNIKDELFYGLDYEFIHNLIKAHAPEACI